MVQARRGCKKIGKSDTNDGITAIQHCRLELNQCVDNKPAASDSLNRHQEQGIAAMEAWKKHWLSREFLAPNVMEIDIDNDVFASAFDLVPEIQQVEAGPEAITLASGLHFNVLSMSSTWSSDMLWIAQDDIRTYEFFEKLFRASGISRHVADRIDFEGFLRLYSGIFVTRSRCEKADMHVDYVEGNNDAFTFIMPLTQNCSEMGLSYINARGEVAEYAYRYGKGLIYGDHFQHSTMPGQTNQRCVLLAFMFGTNKMKNWQNIAVTAAHQGGLHCQPDGTFIHKDTVYDVSGHLQKPLANGRMI